MRNSVVAILVLVCGVFADPQGNVTIFGDLTVSGALRTTSIRSMSVRVDGSISVTHALTAESLTANKAILTTLEAVAISSPTGVLHVAGELSLGDVSVNGTVSATSFIQQDVRQWALAAHDDFEGEVKGWNTDKTNSCDGVDHHIGGHCNEVDKEVKKVFTGLAEHKFLRLQARFHFLDSWEGEQAFAKLGDRVVWTDTNDVRGMHPNSLNICGGDHPDLKMSVPIDVTIPHTGDSVSVSFGSTLDEHPCNESFGVDDVMISLR
eukprot:c1297_g1_i1.p1 GENE.c1297_g1_i1~~c1297_g1_i1.p1  ORF type:complete len:264 (-),score=57.15 c1297_g1_i1:84-875(-)